MTFGDKIKLLRESREPKLTQQQLAKAIGVNQNKISRIESNSFEPNLQDIVKLATFFNVSSDYLLSLPQGMLYPKR